MVDGTTETHIHQMYVYQYILVYVCMCALCSHDLSVNEC